jgi:hypothetical protein
VSGLLASLLAEITAYAQTEQFTLAGLAPLALAWLSRQLVWSQSSHERAVSDAAVSAYLQGQYEANADRCPPPESD